MNIQVPDGYGCWGFDVSESQGPINIQAIQDSGASFLIVKATDGIHDVDPQFHRTMQLCSDRKFPAACYGVQEAYGLVKAEEQARHFLDVTKGCGATLYPWLDFELAKNLGGLEALKAAHRWRDIVAQETGLPVVLYTMPSFFLLLEKYAGHAGDDTIALLGISPLAIAHYTQAYTKPPTIPAPWTDCLYWQASGGKPASRNYATLPGSTVDVDVDFCKSLKGAGP